MVIEKLFGVQVFYLFYKTFKDSERNKKCCLSYKKTNKALAKRSCKQTQVENLGLLATPFSQALRALALTR